MEHQVKNNGEDHRKYSTEDYLALCRSSETRYEYHEGSVLMLPGTSLKQHIIEANIIVALSRWLKNHEHLSLFPGMRVKSPKADFYLYPAISIITGNPLMEDQHFDTLLNPTIVIDVFNNQERSASRIFLYARFPSIKEYIAIEAQSGSITSHTRTNTEEWIRRDFHSPEIFRIESINFELPTHELFSRPG